MGSGSNCSYSLDNCGCISRVPPVHNQLKAPEEIACAFGVCYNATSFHNYYFQMSFNSVYRIYRYSCHKLIAPPFLCKSVEFTDFVGECRFCTAQTTGSTSYTPVNSIILCLVSIPSSARAVCLCLSSFAAKDSKATQIGTCVFVPAEGLAVSNRITAVVVRLVDRYAVICAAVSCCCEEPCC